MFYLLKGSRITMEFLVSVIIPTYKGSRFISRAIRSVLEQDYPNIEIIVIDDNGQGAVDQFLTEKEVNKYKHKVKYFAHEKNSNGAAARNTGIKLSKGEYICFLDDDDLMLPSRISSSVKILQKNNDYDAVLTDVLCTDEKLIPTRIIRIGKEGNCIKELLLNDMFLGTGSNLFFTRKAIETIGYFDESFNRHQDVEYMIRFYREFLSINIPEIMVIKSKNGVNNIPEYKNMKRVKEKFACKFNEDINRLSFEEKCNFYRKQIEQLRFSENLTSNKIDRSLSEKIEYFIYIYIKNTSIFPFFNGVRKRIKSRFLNKEVDERVRKFIDSYR